MMKGFNFKKILPYVGAVIAFIFIAYAYTPEVLKGKIVNQSDISSWQGMAHEILTHNENHPDDRAFWTNSMFGGMPATSISVIYKGDFTQHLYHVFFTGERPASYYLISLIGGFLLLLAFGVNIYLAFLGAIAITFCSYNMQIIQVGHNSKMVAIAFMPWVLASIVYAYKKCALWGGLFFAFALSFQIKANHPQITYYLAIIILGYAIWQFCAAIKDKMFPQFIRTSLILLVAGSIGIATNVNHLWPIYEYGQHTMRGGTELSNSNEPDAAIESGKKSRSGLDLEYATSWSYGIGETANLLIPNFKGGSSSGALSRNSQVYKTLKSNGYAADQAIKALPLYWGPQPFTAGPMYMGAISIFLFILGFFILKGGLKWWVAGVNLLALMLSWGYHLMPVSEFFFNWAPLYNKFRTVSMILVILQILIPIMAVLTVNELLFKQPDSLTKAQVKRGFYWALGITGGFSLLFILIPSLAGDFTSASDNQLPQLLISSLITDRISLLRTDAIRTLLFIVIAAAVLWLGYLKKVKAVQATIVLIVLVLTDLWSVDKRYLNDSHFVSKRDFKNAFTLRPVDNIILKDQDPNYRVLDLSVNTFNDAYTSYHHKTIGGYSPVKMQRYQDLIEHNISAEMGAISNELQGVQTVEQAQQALGYHPVLSMLNTRYIIIDENIPPLRNMYAAGNAWFVNSVTKAANANDEIALLNNIDPVKEAVVAANFISPQYLGEYYNPIANSRGIRCFMNTDSLASIQLTSYSPNKMVYRYNSSTPNIALFSEVFYAPGWTARLYKTTNHQSAQTTGKEQDQTLSQTTGAGEGEPIEIFRANYILRGAILPAGEGEIVFTFKPDSITKGETVSRIASGLLVILLLAGLFVTIKKKL